MVKKTINQTTLDEIAKRNTVSIEEVTKLYTEQYESLIADKRTPVIAEKLAIAFVMNHYRRVKARSQPNTFRPTKEVVTVYGFIYGDNGVFDKADAIRKHADKVIKEQGVQAAIEANLIDGDNHYLDTRLKVYGKENKDYLLPLKETVHFKTRTLHGFFKHNGDTTYKRGTIQTSDNRLADGWSKVKLFTPCQVQAIIDEEDNDTITLRSSSNKDTISVFKRLNEEIDAGKIVEEYVKTRLTPIKDIREAHENSKDAWNRCTIIQGIVAWINEQPSAIGEIGMGVMDKDNEEFLVKVQVPQHLTVDFGELSDIIVFGKTEYTKKKDMEDGKWKTDKDNVQLKAFAIVPKFATPRSIRSTDKDETPIEGWID